jgi:predicted ribosome quality control (RQC) complex YloA/Tae2 family protein
LIRAIRAYEALQYSLISLAISESMHKMNNLEYSFIVNELTLKVVGKHFNRIRKLSENIYRMKIGTTEIICELGMRLHETMLIEKTEQTDKFVEKAGKELDNARLTSIIQVNKDRIVSFVFDNTSLVFEMFGEGNAILVRDGDRKSTRLNSSHIR